MFKQVMTMALGLAMVLGVAACSDYKAGDGQTKAQRNAALEGKARMTVDRFRAEYPGYDKFFETSAGYAVFPNIGKGGAGLGGAYGKGVLYEGGQVVGHTSMKQATIGLQLGGQAYSEIIFFEHAANVAQFKRGDTAFSGNATAVAASEGAGAAADYEAGVAVFIFGEEGLMGEASIGGQRFNYTPKK